ncbi:MAG: hypothetical protein KF800_13450 [Lysobacter sp.]|nr:hypothetical protein [Lysobacter sp.]
MQVLYGNYGHALAEKDPLSGIEYRRLNSVNARNQLVQETFGNGVVLNAQYQHQTGQLTQLHYTKGAANVRKLGYGYDVFGNVRRQSLNDGASREDYAYDELQRMVSAIRSGAASGSINYGYDSVGNLTKKTDFSANTANAYSYTGGSCGGGANAVRSVALAAGGTRTYCYDANGSLVGDNAGLALQYDHQGMTVKATRGAQTDHFRYGPDGARTRSWGSDGARVYLPGYEHRTDTGETKVYVGDYAVISRTGATRKVDYLLKDRLGSVDAVTDSTGAVTETRGYDAFGKPRSGTWNDLAPPKLGSVAVTPKGFTQHEHLNQLELIHMNGRVFDYALGRFFSVDPIIQFPLNSQSLNPYSYILNNPLSGTDPTGYACSTGTNIKTEGGPDCESLGVMNGAPGQYPVAESNQHKSKSGVGVIANGATARQTTQGAEGRKDQASSIDNKGVASNNNLQASSPVNSAAETEEAQEQNSVSHAPVAASQARKVINPSVEARKVFAFLMAKITKNPFDTAEEALDAFEKLFSPFTEKYGVEVGAHIVKLGRFKFEDVTLGTSADVRVPLNRLSVYYVHTHPAWSLDGLSGYLSLSKGVKQGYADVGYAYDQGLYSKNFKGLFAVRAGDNARWYFDYSVASKALEREKAKGDRSYFCVGASCQRQSGEFIRRVK